jgi:hypothetical protein
MDKKQLLQRNEYIEKLQEIDKIQFISFYGDFLGSRTKCVLSCPSHGRGDEFQNQWLPIISSVLAGTTGCPKCSGRYKFTENETLTNLNKKNIVHDGIIGDFKGIYSRIRVICPEHGTGDSFKNPWTPVANDLLIGKNCPKCSGVYKPTLEERVDKLERHTPYKFVSIVTEFTGKKTKVNVFCPTHGEGIKFKAPWTPNFDNLTHRGCPKCGGNYRFSEDEYIEEMELQTDYKFISFEGKWKAKHTKVNLKCKEHGEGIKFQTPWLPSINNTLRGGGCPKCNGSYVLTEQEVIGKINKTRYKFVRFTTPFKTLETRVDLECPTHGLGSNFGWQPAIHLIINRGQGCPTCSYDSWDFKKTYFNQHTWELPRYLYFIRFLNERDNSYFWKIGLNKSEKSSDRYQKFALKKDRIAIDNYQTIKLSNFDATLAELHVLQYYSEHSLNMQKVMKNVNGGTECFSIDILKGNSLENIVKDAKLNLEKYIDLALQAQQSNEPDLNKSVIRK